MKLIPSNKATMWPSRSSSWSTLILVVALSGCASYSGKSLPTGSSRDDTIALMGPPTGRYALPGGERLEYAKGPMGVETFMFDFDARGALVKREQVLDENHFNAIRVGMTGDEVRTLIGRPSRIQGLAFKRTLWSYRFQSFVCQWFQISIETDGKVGDAGYGPDPRCEKPGI